MSRYDIAQKPVAEESQEPSSTLGAPAGENPARTFLEQAQQALLDTANTTFAVKREKLEDARRALASARVYVEVNKLGQAHLDRIDEISDDVEVLNAIAVAEASPYPENPASLENWYPRLEQAKKRLAAEIQTYFQTIGPDPTPASGGFILHQLPKTGQFPPKEEPKSPDANVKAGDVVQRIKGEASTGTSKPFLTLKPSGEKSPYEKLPETDTTKDMPKYDLPDLPVEATPPPVPPPAKSSAMPWIIAGLAAVGLGVFYYTRKKD